MGLDTFIQLVPPPKRPVENGNSGEWSKVEVRLGTVLPQDYKEYIHVFGSGEIGGFIFPFNPYSTREGINLFKRSTEILDALRVIKGKYGEAECPYPLYPELGGLLPWGESENGDALFWLTKGQPDGWNVVINESRGPAFEKYEDSMTGFLTKFISGGITSKIFPKGVPDTRSLFIQPE